MFMVWCCWLTRAWLSLLGAVAFRRAWLELCWLPLALTARGNGGMVGAGCWLLAAVSSGWVGEVGWVRTCCEMPYLVCSAALIG